MQIENTNIPLVKGIEIKTSRDHIYLEATLFNYKLNIDITLLALAIYLTYKIRDNYIYIFPISAMYIGLIYMFWIDLKSINKIEFDLIQKIIFIQNKNPIFLIFNIKKRIAFENIDSFFIRFNESSKADLKRYYIDIKLKTSKSVVLLSFINGNDANKIASFFRSLIK